MAKMIATITDHWNNPAEARDRKAAFWSVYDSDLNVVRSGWKAWEIDSTRYFWMTVTDGPDEVATWDEEEQAFFWDDDRSSPKWAIVEVYIPLEFVQ